ncbi:hypothetical protein Pan241w_55540 [Gimesia alba]|uniref:RiboL-PSP-HEPN domain-containing protein n=1 Tax=Gimesia alba TaxID=2527973 RepID=A0A517RNL6_9PLAN|nr:hypothetical protein [Gimesia alba]QDT45434.1 hypothetical protein Pan241w_55540 [Gimesia alba]
MLAEVARLGRDYIPVLKTIAKEKPSTSPLEKYAEEQSPNFYDLYALVAIRLWSILEAYIRDISCHVIEHVPEVRQRKEFSKLKAPIVDFLNTTNQEQADYLYELIEANCTGALKSGVGRFEAVLSSLGYDGPVDDTVRDELYHLSRLRNCIAHNDGIVDKKLIGGCPWWKGNEGTRVGITAAMARKFLYAVSWYMLEVERRALPSNFDHLDKLEKKQTEYLQELNSEYIPGRFPFS